MHVILATHNKHKIVEICKILAHPDIQIESLIDYPDVVLPPETGTTFVENARVKARTVHKQITPSHTLPPRGGGKGKGGIWILADDSGLIVDVLGGRPGVYSSRYSGEPADYARNNKKLLGELKGLPLEKRTAHFVCSMVLIDPNGHEHEIEGRLDGIITDDARGRGGFGYDPVFYLPDMECTVAELSLDDKNKISHRGRATEKVHKLLLEILEKKG